MALQKSRSKYVLVSKSCFKSIVVVVWKAFGDYAPPLAPIYLCARRP